MFFSPATRWRRSLADDHVASCAWASPNLSWHDAIHEIFGDATITAFEHLAQLSRSKHLVAADGSDSYLDKLSRLAVPTLFLHGADNGCFLPSSTEESLGVLSQVNDPKLYQRRVIPGYGHSDCMFGKHAARDVYPLIVEHLDANH
jgi:cholesterol oxidase